MPMQGRAAPHEQATTVNARASLSKKADTPHIPIRTQTTVCLHTQ